MVTNRFGTGCKECFKLISYSRFNACVHMLSSLNERNGRNPYENERNGCNPYENERNGRKHDGNHCILPRFSSLST